MRRPVTAGLDGFPESRTAAHWAAHEALLRDAPLRLVHAWLLGSVTARQIPREDEQNLRATRLLADTEADLRGRHPGLEITTELVPYEPEGALLAESEKALLLVLGSRGLGSVGGFLLGSTGLRLAAHAACPVALVRGAPGTTPGAAGDVVAGVGTRHPADSVLAYAFDEAARRDATLRVVRADRRLPHPHRSASGGEEDAAAREELDAVLRPWQDKHPGVAVDARLVADSPGRAVVDAARDAALLVVGRHATGAARPHGIGPVAHAAAHHAPCPVAVVPYD
ncbi:universal stress protein [Streptantibioticus parmotrematis]|uniref:universal stress protein n=1 Tax=Streptantibioticus parmotrematis TaxID=2873249 RepID=UPI0033FDC4EC